MEKLSKLKKDIIKNPDKYNRRNISAAVHTNHRTGKTGKTSINVFTYGGTSHSQIY